MDGFDWGAVVGNIAQNFEKSRQQKLMEEMARQKAISDRNLQRAQAREAEQRGNYYGAMGEVARAKPVIEPFDIPDDAVKAVLGDAGYNQRIIDAVPKMSQTTKKDLYDRASDFIKAKEIAKLQGINQVNTANARRNPAVVNWSVTHIKNSIKTMRTGLQQEINKLTGFPNSMVPGSSDKAEELKSRIRELDTADLTLDQIINRLKPGSVIPPEELDKINELLDEMKSGLGQGQPGGGGGWLGNIIGALGQLVGTGGQAAPTGVSATTLPAPTPAPTRVVNGKTYYKHSDGKWYTAPEKD
jgi:hypothetical protein